ncbi:unnamed protein product [Dracunculus medinensis]|uniref:Ground-like domain-containing protein n=1 Tax=Dracunculus medinensis TaxID=318479 RepID=A0A3P7QFC8_DRAME|nr:unnamed protein product [Dracunculus medinensis]
MNLIVFQLRNCNMYLQNIDESSTTKSKRKIQAAVEKKYGGIVNVICSESEFEFVISSTLYCDGGKGSIACIVFHLPLHKSKP